MAKKKTVSKPPPKPAPKAKSSNAKLAHQRGAQSKPTPVVVTEDATDKAILAFFLADDRTVPIEELLVTHPDGDSEAIKHSLARLRRAGFVEVLLRYAEGAKAKRAVNVYKLAASAHGQALRLVDPARAELIVLNALKKCSETFLGKISRAPHWISTETMFSKYEFLSDDCAEILEALANAGKVTRIVGDDDVTRYLPV